jgi:putative transposase
VKANQASYSVALMCRVLGVSPSGYYAWLRRRPSPRRKADDRLAARIRTIHAVSKGTYGAPNIHAELADNGVRVGRKRVARLMRQMELSGVTRRRFRKTTVRDQYAEPAPDLVQRRFAAERPDQLWVADITYVPVLSDFLYLAVVMDVCTRRIVGWAMASHLRTELILEALDMAVEQRQPSGVIHHSDQGTQYTSFSFGERCRQAGVRPSMGSVGDCYDNAMCESFFATLKCELVARQSFQNHAQARAAIFSFIEGWYNPHRRHSGILRLSPINYERKYFGRSTMLPRAA